MKNFKVSSMTSIITDIFTLWLICIITKYDLSELGEQLSSESTCHKGNAYNSRFRRWRQDSPSELTNKTSLYQPALGLT